MNSVSGMGTYSMIADPYTDRFARVRDRCTTALAGKIEEACAAIPNLSDSAPAAAGAVAETYRCVHGIVGVGPTVGFPASGNAAHDVECARAELLGMGERCLRRGAAERMSRRYDDV